MSPQVAKPTDLDNRSPAGDCQSKKTRKPDRRHLTEARRAYIREYGQRRRSTATGKQKACEYVRLSYWKVKLDCLIAYGGDPPRCACCGETEIGFLTIDHVNTDGHKTRPKTRRLFSLLRKRGFPNDPPLQVLCWNCNVGRDYNNGVCPHHQPMTFASYRRFSRLKANAERENGGNEPAIEIADAGLFAEVGA